MLRGVLWVVGGSAASVITYVVTEGEWYIVACGAILFGFIDFARGFVSWLSRDEDRLVWLREAMNDLVRQHPTPQAVDDWFPYITLYAGSVSPREDQLCRAYLRRRAYAGYKVYDEERLR